MCEPPWNRPLQDAADKRLLALLYEQSSLNT